MLGKPCGGNRAEVLSSYQPVFARQCCPLQWSREKPGGDRFLKLFDIGMQGSY